jgi:hypothetical protein
MKFSCALASIGTDKADLELGAITVQAGARVVGPSLVCAALDNMNFKPIALPEDGRLLSFDLWGKSGQYEQGGCNEGGNCDGRERFDHLIPN